MVILFQIKELLLLLACDIMMTAAFRYVVATLEGGSSCFLVS